MHDMSPARRRELRAAAHHLDPVVSISGNGLSESVLKEIEIALKAHELIKIRVFGDERELRQQYMIEICEQTGASPVQSIGKLLVIWRAGPVQEASSKPVFRARKGKPLTKRAAQERAETGKTPSPRPRRPAASGNPLAGAAPKARRAFVGGRTTGGRTAGGRASTGRKR